MFAKLLGVFTGLPPWALYAAGGALIIVAIWGANKWENSTVAEAAKVEANALSEKKTMEAINVLSSASDKRRAKLAYCRSVGRLYDFNADKCLDI